MLKQLRDKLEALENIDFLSHIRPGRDGLARILENTHI